jgi:hypothetical protein
MEAQVKALLATEDEDIHVIVDPVTSQKKYNPWN